jgi:hypothetical protein
MAHSKAKLMAIKQLSLLPIILISKHQRFARRIERYNYIRMNCL